jgi:hypothetical protein
MQPILKQHKEVCVLGRAIFVFFCLLLLGFTLRVKCCGTKICIQEGNKDAKEIATNAPNHKIQLQNLQVDQYWNQILDLLRHSSFLEFGNLNRVTLFGAFMTKP